MAYGEITLAAPITATTPYPPPLVLADFAGGAEGYSRSALGFVEVSDRSVNGTAKLTGPARVELYQWQLQLHLPEATARHLAAFAGWQSKEYRAGRDGRLVLTDEVLYLPSEPSPHSRTLVASINETWPTGSPWVYGYGRFDVILTVPEAYRSPLGRGTLGPEELVQIGAVEL